MKLRPKHISKLSPLEKRLYAPLIGHIDYKGEVRDEFVSKSLRYVEGDETILPFPERSKMGIMLFSLSQHLARSAASAVYDIKAPENILHVKRKLLALGSAKAYALPSEYLLACIYANGRNPFNFWRHGQETVFELKNLAPVGGSVICALNPPAGAINDTSEWGVRGMLLNSPAAELEQLPKEAAHLGLIDVQCIEPDRFWLTKEHTTNSKEPPSSRA